MRVQLLAMLAAVAGLGCSSQALQECAEPPKLEQLSEPERKALSHSVSVLSAQCNDSNNQCGFRVAPNKVGEILVHIDFFYSKHCDRIVGGFQTDIYDASGEFLRTVHGY